MWQVDWRSHLWRTESSWDVSNSSAVSDQNSLYQIRPSGSSPRSSIMWSALKLKSYLLLDLLRIRSLSCITTLKDESRTVELCMWCSLSHKRRLWDVQQNAIFQKCLWWMWIFFFFSFFLEKAFQKRRLGGNKSESGWTWWSQSAELSYISSFHLQLPLIHDFTVLNSLKSCVNMLVGGHLHRLPCKPAQSTQKQHCRSSKIKKSSKKHSQAANSLPQPETSEDKKEPCVFLFF